MSGIQDIRGRILRAQRLLAKRRLGPHEAATLVEDIEAIRDSHERGKNMLIAEASAIADTLAGNLSQEAWDLVRFEDLACGGNGER